MKKLIVVLLAIFMCFGLFACAPAEEEDGKIIMGKGIVGIRLR